MMQQIDFNPKSKVAQIFINNGTDSFWVEETESKESANLRTAIAAATVAFWKEFMSYKKAETT